MSKKDKSDTNLLESKVKTIPVYSVNFQINKAERFIFPKNDPPLKNEWETKQLPDKDIFKFLINLYSDRVDQELLTEWNFLAQRNTKISEVSKGGTPFTDLQTKQLGKLGGTSKSRLQQEEVRLQSCGDTLNIPYGAEE